MKNKIDLTTILFILAIIVFILILVWPIKPNQTSQQALNQLPSLTKNVQEINMDVVTGGWQPNSFVLKKGIPVRWNINAKELNACNSQIVVPDYNLKISLKQGSNVIEFTPDKAGTVRWTCGMGMIPGTFLVTDDGKASDEQKSGLANSASQQLTCGQNGGGCGCGQ